MTSTFLRTLGPILIVGLLVPFASMACDDVPACVGKWGSGRRIQVVLVAGGTVTGHIGALESDGFILDPDKRSGTSRHFRYAELQSATTKMTAARKWLIFAGIYGTVTALALLVSDR